MRMKAEQNKARGRILPGWFYPDVFTQMFYLDQLKVEQIYSEQTSHSFLPDFVIFINDERNRNDI